MTYNITINNYGSMNYGSPESTMNMTSKLNELPFQKEMTQDYKKSNVTTPKPSATSHTSPLELVLPLYNIGTNTPSYMGNEIQTKSPIESFELSRGFLNPYQLIK